MSKKLKYYGSTASLHPDTILWLEVLQSTFGTQPSEGLITDIDNLISGHDEDGDWQHFVRYWIHGGMEVQDYARISIKNPSSTPITEVNSPSWNNSGYIGNSLNRYLNTNFNYSTDGGGILTRSSVYQAIYCTTNAATNTCEAGVMAPGNKLETYTRFGDTVTYVGANTPSAYAQSSLVGSSLGYFSAKRSGNPAPTVGARNGTVFNTSSSQSDNALPNRNDLILCRNNSGTADQFTGKRIAARILGGGGVTDSNARTRFQTFAVARGFNV